MSRTLLDLPQIKHLPRSSSTWKIFAEVVVNLVGPARDPVSGGAVREGSERKREHSDTDRHRSRPLPRRRSTTEARLDRLHSISHRGRRLGDQRGLQSPGSARLQGGLDRGRGHSAGDDH